jgi:GntR family transcriptional regulator/MocR family aminotransferase
MLGRMSRPPYVSVHIPAPAPGRRVSGQQIVEAYAAEIRAGRLPAGCRVPPVRVLEQQLGLSKNTVQVAYDELVARGLLEAREREGVFVAAPPEIAAAPARAAAVPPLPRCKPVPPLFRRAPLTGAQALGSVFIDPDLLPRAQIEECLRAALRDPPGLHAFYDFQGFPPLREAIAQRLCRRGMDVTAGQVITTVGSQQALDIVCRSLEIQRVAVEDPVYPHARALFERNGTATCALALDPFQGIDLERWAEELAGRRPGLLYAITSFQNPTGYSYSTHELTRLLELAAAHDVALLEDDWGSDMLSGSEYRPSLRLLGGPSVLYVNSFTKKVWPALRVGYLVAPEALVPTLVAAKRLSTLGSPPLGEAAMAEFLERGYYDTHLARLQAELDRRYEACLESLRALMPEEVRWTTPGGGPTLWVDLPRRIELGALGRALAARGVEIEDARPAFAAEPHLHGFRVSYAHAPVPRVRQGLEAVAEETRKLLA